MEDLELNEEGEAVEVDGATGVTERPQAAPGRILRNMSVLVAGQGLAIPIVFATSVVLVRYLGSEGFGEYSFIYAYLGLYIWLASFGLENIVVREASQRPDDSGAIWGSALALATFWSMVTLAFAGVLAAGFGYSRSTLILLAIGAVEIIALVPPRLTSISFQIHLEQHKTVITNLARQALWLLIVLVLVRQHASLTTIVASRVGLAILETAAMLWLARGLLGRPLGISRREMSHLMRQGWPLALTYLSIAVYHRIDRVMLERFVGPQELGYYAAADNILTFFGVAPLAFMMSIYPILCRRVDDRPGFDRVAKSSFRLILFFVVGACGTMFGISHWLIPAIYGADFAFTADLINILVLAQIAVAYGTVLSQILIATSLQKLITITTAVGAVVNVGVNLWALPRYGAVGASWVTVASYWIAGALVFHVFPSARHHSGIGLATLARVLAVGVVVFVPVEFAFRNNVAATLIAALVFIVASFVFRVLRRNDLELVKRALKRGDRDEGEPPSPDALSDEETLAEVARLELS